MPDNSHEKTDLTALAVFLLASNPKSAFTFAGSRATSAMFNKQLGGGYSSSSHKAFTKPGVNGVGRIGEPRMEEEYSLNNLRLPGPMQLTGNNVLLKMRRKYDQKTGGGLYIQEDEEDQTVAEAVVVAAGPGKNHPNTGKLLPCPCKEGDVVIVADQKGAEAVLYQQTGHLILDADQVLGSFEGGRVDVASFRPFLDGVLIKMEEAASETASGLLLAKSDDSKFANQGEVIAVGPGRYSGSGDFEPPSVNTGEKLMFEPFAGTQVSLENTQFKVVSEDAVMAKW